MFSGPLNQWTGVVRNTATLDPSAHRVTGGASAKVPIVAAAGRIYAEPRRGWTGQIRPVATLQPQRGPLGAMTVSGETVLQSGCRYPIGTPDSGCAVAEWLFEPVGGRWQGTIAAQPAAQDGYGNAGRSPPEPVLADPSTLVAATPSGEVTIDHITGHYGYSAPPATEEDALSGP